MTTSKPKKPWQWVRWTSHLLLLAALCACVAWGLMMYVSVKSVCLTGPVLFVLGATILLVGRWSRYRGAGRIGLAYIGICLFLVALVNLLELSPQQAQEPFAWIGTFFLLVMLPVTASVWKHPPPAHDPDRCPNCNYLLYGLIKPRCPECGAPFDPAQVARLSPPTAQE